MSRYAIKEYRKEIEDYIHYGGANKETSIRTAFITLLNKHAGSKDLKLVADVSLK